MFVSNSKYVLLSLQHHPQVSNIIQISGVVIRDGGAGVVPVDPDGDGTMVVMQFECTLVIYILVKKKKLYSIIKIM